MLILSSINLTIFVFKVNSVILICKKNMLYASVFVVLYIVDLVYINSHINKISVRAV